MEKITIKVKPNSRKMTPEELQGYLRAKAIGSGVTKTGRLTAGMTNIAVAYATATKMGLCPKPLFLPEK